MVMIAGIECGSTGYGLLGLNLPPVKAPEVAIPIMKKALESGCTYWAGAEYYGTSKYNSLHLIHAYFTKYPEDVAKVCLSIKIGFEVATRKLKTDEAGIRDSFANCTRILSGVKRIDVLSAARINPDVPIETTVSTLNALVQEGQIGAVGMVECSAATLRRAAAVCPIATVEVEFSLFTPDILTNEVASVAHEIGATVIAYSPLGRGLISGTVTAESLSATDSRSQFPRFQGEALENNLKLVREVDGMAGRLGVTKPQIALGWIRAQSGRQGMPDILAIPGTTNVQRLEENAKEVVLGEEDAQELDEILKKNPVVGDRYPAAFQSLNWG